MGDAVSQSKKEFDWFDHPHNRRKLWWLLWGTCALAVIGELFVERHAHFGWDEFFGFYAVLGFSACVVSILVAKGLGYFLKVREDYYGDE